MALKGKGGVVVVVVIVGSRASFAGCIKPTEIKKIKIRNGPFSPPLPRHRDLLKGREGRDGPLTNPNVRIYERGKG